MKSPYVYGKYRCRDHFIVSVSLFLGISVFLRRYSYDFGEKA